MKRPLLIHKTTICVFLILFPVAAFGASTSLVINEFMINPLAGDEWIELIAKSDVDATGYTLTDNDGNSFTFPALNLSAGDIVVVRLGAGADDMTGPVYELYAGSGPWLENNGDDIQLDDASAIPVDYVSYGSVNSPPGGQAPWSNPIGVTTVEQGHSLGIDRDGADTDNGNNWIERTFFTDGEPNWTPDILIEKDGPSAIDKADTAGDEFVITITNEGDGPAYVEDVLDDYPDDFLVNSVISVQKNDGSGFSAVAGYTTNDTGTDVTFDNLPALMPDEIMEIRLNLATDCTTANGFASNYGQLDFYDVPEGGALQSINNRFDTEVKYGILRPEILATEINGVPLATPTATPHTEVGDTVTFQVVLYNEGEGELYDVTSETTWGTGLSYIAGTISCEPTLNCTVGATITTTLATPSIPGETRDDAYSFTFEVSVNSCFNITGETTAQERCTAATDALVSAVELELKNPNIDYDITTLPMVIPYGGSQLVHLDITNTDDPGELNDGGRAYEFELDTDFEGYSVGITPTAASLAAGWSYDAPTGTFSYNPPAPNEFIDVGETVPLEFTLAGSGGCADRSPGGLVIFNPLYENSCDEPFYAPRKFYTFSTDQVPGVSITKTVTTPDGNEYATIGDHLTYTITITVSEPNSFTGDIHVDDLVPSSILNVAAVVSGGTLLLTGNDIDWDIDPTADLDGSNQAVLTIDGDIDMDECLQGTYIDNEASYSATDNLACPLSGSAGNGGDERVYVNNNPDNTVTVQKSSSGTIETCDSAGVVITNSYDIGTGVPGLWNDAPDPNTNFSDDLASGSYCYITGTAEYNLDTDPTAGQTWTGWTAIPGANISYTVGGSLDIDLGFFDGVDVDNDVAGNELQIRYSVYLCESSGTPATQTLDMLSDLTFAGNGGSCGGTGTYTQHLLTDAVRGNIIVDIDLHPDIVEDCGEYQATITVTKNTTPDIYDLVLDFPTDNYEYLGGLVTAGFGGLTPTVDDSGNPVLFSFDSTGSPDPVTAGGTLTFDIRKRCGADSDVSTEGTYTTGTDASTCCTGGICGGISRSDSDTDDAVLNNAGNIVILVTPEDYPINSTDLQWIIYVTNRGSGTAYNVEVSDVLGPNLTFVDSLVDGAAPGAFPGPPYPTEDVQNDTPAVDQTTLFWELGDMAPKETIAITVNAQMSGYSCDIADSFSIVTAQWGCSGAYCQQLPGALYPRFTFPDAEATALNIFPYDVNMCEIADIIFRVRNNSRATVYNVELVQNLLLTNLVYIPNSTEVSSDGITYVTGPEPNITGGGTILTWQGHDSLAAGYLDIAPPDDIDLVDLEPGEEVYIHYQVYTDCQLPIDPTISGQGSYQKPCDVGSGRRETIFEQSRVIPYNEPEMTVIKEARNETAGDPGFTQGNVFATNGDIVEYRITVINDNSNAAAQNVTLEDTIHGDLSFLSFTHDPVENEGGAPTQITGAPNLEYSIEDVDPNDTDVYFLRVQVIDCDEEVPNTATIHYGCPPTAGHPAGCDDFSASGSHDLYGRIITFTDIGQEAEVSSSDFTVCGGEITVTVTNTGARTDDITIQPTLPDYAPNPGGWIIDTSVPYSTVFSPAPDQTVTDDFTDPYRPLWTIDQLDHNQSVTLTFNVRGNESFCDDDLLTDPDPSGFGPTTIPFEIFVTDACGGIHDESQNLNLTPTYPDLDIVSITPSQTLAFEGGAVTYDIILRNNGTGPADNLDFTFYLGDGYTVTSATGGGAIDNGTDPRTVAWDDSDLTGGGSLAAGGTINLSVTATVNAGNLEVEGISEGACSEYDGTLGCPTFRHSYDNATSFVNGMNHTKRIIDANEPGTQSSGTLASGARGNTIEFEIRIEILGEGAYPDFRIYDNPEAEIELIPGSFMFDGDDPALGGSFVAVGADTASTTPDNGIQVYYQAGGGNDYNFYVDDAIDGNGDPSFTVAAGAGSRFITIRLRARVLDTADNTYTGGGDDREFQRSWLDFDYDYDNDGTVDISYHYNDPNPVRNILREENSVDVLEPVLTPSKTYPGYPPTVRIVDAGDTEDFTLVFENANDPLTSPAYDVVVYDAIPFGMRSIAPTINSVFIDTDGDRVLTGADRSLTAGVDYTMTWPVACLPPPDDWCMVIELDSGAWGDTANTNVIDPGEALVIEYTGEVDSNSGAGLVMTNIAYAEYDSLRGDPDGTDGGAPDYDYNLDYTYTTGQVTTDLATEDTEITKASTMDGSVTGEGGEITYVLTFPNPVQGVYLYGDDDTGDPTDDPLNIDPEFTDIIPDGLEIRDMWITVNATRACENVYGVTVPPYGGGAGACAADDREYRITTTPVAPGTRNRDVQIQFNKLYPGDYLIITIKTDVHATFDDGSVIPDGHIFINEGAIEVYTKPSTEPLRTSNVYNSNQILTEYEKLVTIVPDRSSQVRPGSWVIYEHTVNNRTSQDEEVCFSTASTLMWDWVVFDDSNNILTDGATVNSITVPGDDYIKIYIKYFIPSDTPPGTVDGTTVFLHPYRAGACQQAEVYDTVLDTTVVNDVNLKLTKEVRRVDSINPPPPPAEPWTDSNTAYPCDIIEYRITFTNISAEVYYHLEVNDFIPEWTDFQPDSYGASQDVQVRLPDGSDVYIDVVGIPRELKLDLTQPPSSITELHPGESGFVMYQVRVEGDGC